MKCLFFICFLVALAACTKVEVPPIHSKTQILQPTTISAYSIDTFIRPDHIFVVWFENKAYSQIIGSHSAPYINSLVARGTLFTNSYALFHPSYPNYIAWFSGSNWGVNTDACIRGTPFGAKTMYNALHEAGRTFKWYSEGLPFTGSDTCWAGRYVERHNPTTIFSTVPKTANVPLSSVNWNDTFSFKKLPNVAVITPNVVNDMHDSPVSQGDQWLQTKFSKLINWCKKHNSVFIVYFDEDNKLTDNRIPVVMVGQHIKAAYQNNTHYTHYSFSKSILYWQGAENAFTWKLAHGRIITGMWNNP